MIITITGKAASGKSTVAKMIAKELGYKHHSMGDLQRELARELGMTIEELGELEKTNPKYDHMMDDKQVKLAEDNDNFVIDGWLSAHFIPKSYKIFLDVDIDVAVKRRLAHKREEESFDSPEEVKRSIINRQKTNHERWYEYYMFDFLDMDNYDLVIDTSDMTPGMIVERILKEIKNKL